MADAQKHKHHDSEKAILLAILATLEAILVVEKGILAKL